MAGSSEPGNHNYGYSIMIGDRLWHTGGLSDSGNGTFSYNVLCKYLRCLVLVKLLSSPPTNGQAFMLYFSQFKFNYYKKLKI